MDHQEQHHAQHNVLLEHIVQLVQNSALTVQEEINIQEQKQVVVWQYQAVITQQDVTHLEIIVLVKVSAKKDMLALVE